MSKLDNEAGCLQSSHMFKSLRKIKHFKRLNFENKMVVHGKSFNNPQNFSAEKAHDVDHQCVDWNPLDNNLKWTGSDDNNVCRNLTSGSVGSPIHIFEGHSAAVLSAVVSRQVFCVWKLGGG